jgi:outer membrane protein
VSCRLTHYSLSGFLSLASRLFQAASVSVLLTLHFFFYRCGRCVLLMLVAGAMAGLSLPAQAFDPFDTRAAVPASPASGFLSDPSADPCHFAPLPAPLGLFDAISRALCRNPQTRSAWADVKAATAAVGISDAAYLPTLKGSVQRVRDHTKTVVTPQPFFDSAQFDNVDTATLSLSWVLYDFGGREAARRNAKALRAAAQANQNKALQTVFFNTAKDYYAAESAEANVESVRDLERNAKDSLAVATARVDMATARPLATTPPVNSLKMTGLTRTAHPARPAMPTPMAH